MRTFIFILGIISIAFCQTKICLTCPEIDEQDFESNPKVYHNQPYSFFIYGIDDPFLLDFFVDWNQKKIIVYKDSTFNQIFNYSEFLTLANLPKAFKNKNNILNKKYEINDYLANYYSHLSYSVNNLKERKPIFGQIDLLHDSLQKPILLFFKPDQKINFKNIQVFGDYTSNNNLNPAQIFEMKKYNYYVESGVPNFDLSFLEFVQSKKSHKNVTFLIPRQFTETNHIKADNEDFKTFKNEVFIQDYVSKIWHEILKGNISFYDGMTPPQKMDLKTVYNLIKSHESYTGLDISHSNIDKGEFDFGLIEVEVAGKMVQNDGKTGFVAEKLLLIWQNNVAENLTSAIGFVNFNELISKNILFENKKSIDFLSSEQFYSLFLQVNDAYPSTLNESYYIKDILMSGKWNNLKPQWKIKEVLKK